MARRKSIAVARHMEGHDRIVNYAPDFGPQGLVIEQQG